MNNIKAARLNSGLSQKEIAVTLGVSVPTVSDWESGKKFPSGKNLVKLAQALHTTTDYLLGCEETEKTASIDADGQGEAAKGETPAPEDRRAVRREDLMAAFWGGDKDLSEEDLDAMWQDVENFAAFVAEQRKRGKQG